MNTHSIERPMPVIILLSYLKALGYPVTGFKLNQERPKNRPFMTVEFVSARMEEFSPTPSSDKVFSNFNYNLSISSVGSGSLHNLSTINIQLYRTNRIIGFIKYIDRDNLRHTIQSELSYHGPASAITPIPNLEGIRLEQYSQIFTFQMALGITEPVTTIDSFSIRGLFGTIERDIEIDLTTEE